MDFRQLEAFLAVARLKSFSRAAETLYLSQPTVSTHIHNLEVELGTVLFQRNGKSVTLTKAGEVLFDYAIELINQRENALVALGEFKGRVQGSLEISASTIPEQYFLPRVLARFNQVYPEVEYRLSKYDSREVIQKVAKGEIPFGIVGSKIPQRQLEYLEVFEDEILLVGPNTSCSTFPDKVGLSDLLDQPFIMREKGSGTRAAVERVLRELNLSPDELRQVAIIEDTQTIIECVKNGLGLSFISDKAVERELAGGSLKVIEVEDLKIRRKFFFVHHKQRLLSPLAARFKKFILGELK